MKKWPFFALCALLILASVGTTPPALQNDAPPPGLKPTVDGNCAFAMDLYAHLKDADGNLFLSPYSVSSALAIAYGGARGNTEKQMSATLHIPADQAAFHSAMLQLRRTFAKIDGSRWIKLNIANGLWTQWSCIFTPEYLNFAKANYGAAANPVDFTKDRESARRQINLWVERETRQKIKNALPSGSLSAYTRAVIVNAIYFKGDWASRFDERETKPDSFWITPAQLIKTRMMHQKHAFRYAEQDDLQIMELPYIGHELSMFILLPKERDGLLQIEKHLNSDNIAKWTKDLGVRTVDVLFPKFAMESRFPLKQTLSTMGMSDAFSSSRADFTGMALEKPLYLDVVDHAALVEVDEQGTVAAAATTAVAIGCAAPSLPPPATFHADHPFIFLIRDNFTGTILFLGRVTDPTK